MKRISNSRPPEPGILTQAMQPTQPKLYTPVENAADEVLVYRTRCCRPLVKFGHHVVLIIAGHSPGSALSISLMDAAIRRIDSKPA